MPEVIPIADGVVCTVRLNRRAKRVSVTVYPDASVSLTLPRASFILAGKQFIQSRREWIMRAVSKVQRKGFPKRSPFTRQHYLKNRETARALAHDRLSHFNTFYAFSYGRVAIKNHQARWGSCSSKGNLNFNYRIAFLPPHLCDYVVVHELCHLKAFDHSPTFWQLVERAIPDYKERRRELRQWGMVVA